MEYPASRRTWYEILGVAGDATVDEIKKAYRELSSVHHPDKNPGGEYAVRRFQDVSTAHAVLTSPVRRRVYDDSLARAVVAQRRQHREKQAKERIQERQARRKDNIVQAATNRHMEREARRVAEEVTQWSQDSQAALSQATNPLQMTAALDGTNVGDRSAPALKPHSSNQARRPPAFSELERNPSIHRSGAVKKLREKPCPARFQGTTYEEHILNSNGHWSFQPGDDELFRVETGIPARFNLQQWDQGQATRGTPRESNGTLSLGTSARVRAGAEQNVRPHQSMSQGYQSEAGRLPRCEPTETNSKNNKEYKTSRFRERLNL